MTTKTIPIPCNTVNDRIAILCGLLHITVEAEILVITTIYSLNNGGPAMLESDERRIACVKNKISYENFSVSLSRLMKRKVIAKIGNTYVLSKIFTGIDKADVLVINWQA